MATWSTRDIEYLIDLYEENEVLYNVTLQQYSVRNARMRALTKIAEALGKTGKMLRGNLHIILLQ